MKKLRWKWESLSFEIVQEALMERKDSHALLIEVGILIDDVRVRKTER